MDMEIALHRGANALSQRDTLKRKARDASHEGSTSSTSDTAADLVLLSAKLVHDRLVSAAKNGLLQISPDGRRVNALHKHAALFVAKSAVSAFVSVVLVLREPLGPRWACILSLCTQKCAAACLGHSAHQQNKSLNYSNCLEAVVQTLSSGPTRSTEESLVSAARDWTRNVDATPSIDHIEQLIDNHTSAKTALDAAVSPLRWSCQLFEKV